MKVFIDPKICIFCGACEELTEKAIISPGDKPASLNPKANLKDRVVQENIKMAAETCPQHAIKIKP